VTGEGAAMTDIDATLIGGPTDFPECWRCRRVAPDADVVKVEHVGGYEHFVRDGAHLDDGPAVFRWSTRTKIAE
jgi:hypothetical protein